MATPTMKDAPQLLRYAFDDDTNTLKVAGQFVPEAYDTVELTYVAAGNGVGEIETATYIFGGTVIAVLTCTYNALNKLESVVRT